MRLRALGAVLAAATTVVSLSSCDSKVGQAAVVQGHRISDTQVASYVTRSGPSAQAIAAAAQQNQTIQPRVQVLSSLIQEQIYTRVLDATGTVPSDNALSALHDEAAQRLLGATVSGDAYDAQLSGQIKAFGYGSSFVPLLLRVAELEEALIERTKVTSLAELAAAIAKHPVSISVSGRYGTWDPSQLNLSSGTGAGLPDFVTFGSTKAATS